MSVGILIMMNLDNIDQSLLKKAESGDATAQFELSMLLPLEHRQHISLLTSAAQQGHEQALLCMARYEQRQKNFEGAMNWLNQAKDLNIPRAYFLLAEIFKLGEDVPLDLEQSIEYYKQAADLGETDASFELFKIYKDGIGVRKNKEIAEKYLNLAKQNLHIEAAAIEF